MLVDKVLAPCSDPSVSGMNGRYRSRQHSVVSRLVQAEFDDKRALRAPPERIDLVDTGTTRLLLPLTAGSLLVLAAGRVSRSAAALPIAIPSASDTCRMAHAARISPLFFGFSCLGRASAGVCLIDAPLAYRKVEDNDQRTNADKPRWTPSLVLQREAWQLQRRLWLSR